MPLDMTETRFEASAGSVGRPQVFDFVYSGKLERDDGIHRRLLQVEPEELATLLRMPPPG